jgi:hypothetical protein
MTAPGIKRRNSISGQFAPRLIEMLESPAYCALSLSAHRVMSRIEIELGAHGGNDNGRLPVTKQDLMRYGVSHDQIAPAIRELEALGFIRVMERGRGGNAEHRKPNLFFLTFAHGRDSRANPPSHDWRRIKTMHEAESIASAARANKNPDAVRFGLRRAAKNRTRSRKPGPAAVPKSGTETRKSPVLNSRTTGSVRKPGPLSISRGGGRMSPGHANGKLPMDGTVRLVLATLGRRPPRRRTPKSNCAQDRLSVRGVKSSGSAMAAQGHSTQSQNGDTQP